MRVVNKIIFLLLLCPWGAFAATCPNGFVAYEYDMFVPPVVGVCPAGYVAHDVVDVCSGASNAECWLVEQMRALCGAGVTQIKTSSGVVVSLYSERVTNPSFCVRFNNNVCYADMVSGQASDAINLKYGDVIYHLE